MCKVPALIDSDIIKKILHLKKSILTTKPASVIWMIIVGG